MELQSVVMWYHEKPNGVITTIVNGILRKLNVVAINTLSTVPKICRSVLSIGVLVFCKVSVHQVKISGGIKIS